MTVFEVPVTVANELYFSSYSTSGGTSAETLQSTSTTSTTGSSFANGSESSKRFRLGEGVTAYNADNDQTIAETITSDENGTSTTFSISFPGSPATTTSGSTTRPVETVTFFAPTAGTSTFTTTQTSSTSSSFTFKSATLYVDSDGSTALSSFTRSSTFTDVTTVTSATLTATVPSITDSQSTFSGPWSFTTQLFLLESVSSEKIAALAATSGLAFWLGAGTPDWSHYGSVAFPTPDATIAGIGGLTSSTTSRGTLSVSESVATRSHTVTLVSSLAAYAMRETLTDTTGSIRLSHTTTRTDSAQTATVSDSISQTTTNSSSSIAAITAEIVFYADIEGYSYSAIPGTSGFGPVPTVFARPYSESSGTWTAAMPTMNSLSTSLVTLKSYSLPLVIISFTSSSSTTTEPVLGLSRSFSENVSYDGAAGSTETHITAFRSGQLLPEPPVVIAPAPFVGMQHLHAKTGTDQPAIYETVSGAPSMVTRTELADEHAILCPLMVNVPGAITWAGASYTRTLSVAPYSEAGAVGHGAQRTSRVTLDRSPDTSKGQSVYAAGGQAPTRSESSVRFGNFAMTGSRTSTNETTLSSLTPVFTSPSATVTATPAGNMTLAEPIAGWTVVTGKMISWVMEKGLDLSRFTALPRFHTETGSLNQFSARAAN